VSVLGLLNHLEIPALEVFATFHRAVIPCFLAFLEALWNSRQRVVRWGAHQGLEWWEGLEPGLCSFRSATSLCSDAASHASRFPGEGPGGAGGVESL